MQCIMCYNLQPDCCSVFLLANLVYIQNNCKHVFVCLFVCLLYFKTFPLVYETDSTTSCEFIENIIPT